MLWCTSHITGECNTGKRYSLPNSRIMIHQPLGGAQGQETDLEIQVNSRCGLMPILFSFLPKYFLVLQLLTF
jgi:ATP-dependent protease ClpP protease subunit